MAANGSHFGVHAAFYWTARVVTGVPVHEQEFYKIGLLQSRNDEELPCIELLAFITLCRVTVMANF
jgi:hypothetical protein